MTPEGKVKALVKAWAKKHDQRLFSIIPSPMGNTTGFPDLFGILKGGMTLLIEVKAEGKRNNLSAHQKEFQAYALSMGAFHFVVSCQDDLDDMDTTLASAGYF
jgi:hypothetical protein